MAAPQRSAVAAETEAETLPALPAPGGSLDELLQGEPAKLLEQEVLPEFLSRQRWFAGKSAGIGPVSIQPVGAIPGEPNRLVVVDVGGAGDQRYFLPLKIIWGDQNLGLGAPNLPFAIAKVRDGVRVGALVDAAFDERFVRDLLAAMMVGAQVPTERGALRFSATEKGRGLDLSGEVRPVGAEQSNVSMLVGNVAMVKLYRQVRPGEQPEIEVARFLTELAGFPNTPAYLGHAEYHPEGGEPVAVAAAFAFVGNRGDAWGVLLDALERDLEGVAAGAPTERAAVPHPDGDAVQLPAVLGRRTAEMHVALATPTDEPAFAAEAVTAADVARWVDSAVGEAETALAGLGRMAPGLPAEARADGGRLADARRSLFDRLRSVGSMPRSGLRIRMHGDYHLGQVLVADNDVVIIDFEGEPRRPLVERREKTSPLRDVAGMLRSFDYAAWSALDRLRARHGELDPAVRGSAFRWRDGAVRDFLDNYMPIAEAAGLLPQDPEFRRGLLDLFLIQKACYELGYEAAHRPTWISIPLRGLLDLISVGETQS